MSSKRNVLGVLVDDLDYDDVVARVIDAGRRGQSLGVSALAVHGVMTGVDDDEHRYRLNHLDVVTPDGQPVRWALRWLHRSGLRDRVYGPTLMLRICEAAAAEGLPVFLYGSESDTLAQLRARLVERIPGLVVAGTEPSKFRTTSAAEKDEIVARIRQSGARIVFAGLGCPRQEVFAFEYCGPMSMPVVAVGAAFDYHAGLQREPPAALQRAGLQWLVRLVQEPRRLWRRYLLLNPRFLALVAAQRTGMWRPAADAAQPPREEIRYG